MTIQITYDGLEERDEAIDAISVEAYRTFISAFGYALRHEWKHGEHCNQAYDLIENLWAVWNNLKADLPRGGE